MEGEAQKRLITKVQYKNFEPGEFTDRQPRTAEETIHLIEAFPWQEQRDHLHIGLTGPSVSIEGADGDFLKLALYYNDKFVLYYVDVNHHLYSHSFIDYHDAYPYIRTFFVNGAAPAGFKDEQTLFQHVSVHFKDQDFSYTIGRSGRFAVVIAVQCAALLGILICSAALLIALGRQPAAGYLLILPAILAFLWTWGVAVAINHYQAGKNKVLVISRGKDEFSYGPLSGPETFNKKDIMDVTTYGGHRRGGGYSILTRVQINFNDGRSIDISCLLIPQEKLVAKLWNSTQRIGSLRYAFIPAGAASPF